MGAKTLLSRCLLLSVALFGLIACSDPPTDQPMTVAYGEPANYLQHEQIHFPDFTLRYLGDRTAPNLDQLAYDADRGHSFEIASGADKITVNWNDFNNTKRTERFIVGEADFFLRLNSSYFQNRELKSGELEIWTAIQLQENMPPRPALASADGIRVLAERYKAYRHSLESGDWNQVKAFLSSNRIENLERSKIPTQKNKPALIASLAQAAPKPETLTAQSGSFSQMVAKLYLQSATDQEGVIVGVEFVKEASDWQIESETVIPNNEAGEQWVALFLSKE